MIKIHSPDKRSFLSLFIALALFYTGISVPSLAQNFPNKPLTLIVSSAPAGPLDAAGRMLSDYLSRNLGKPVVIENRPGASGAVAAGLLAKT